MRWLLYLTLATAAAWAASPGDLLIAAAKGDTAAVRALLKRGVNIESTDKNGRTPLMLAAQHGHAAVVNALLEAGAKADARDNSGLTAYGLTLFEPAGHGKHEAALLALPRPTRFRLAAIAGWSPAALMSSCFRQREQIVQQIGLMRPDESLLRELQAYIKTSGNGLAELMRVDARNIQPLTADSTEGVDGILLMEIEPGSACTGGNSDTLTFDVDLQVFRASDRRLLLHKSIGGGVKSMRATVISNANQFKPMFETWLDAQAGPVYLAALEALMRSPQ